MQIDKRVEKKKVARIKKIAITEQNSSPSTSSFSLYNSFSKNDNSNDASIPTSSLMKGDSSPHEQGEEINCSQAITKIQLEIHWSSNV